MAGKVFRAVRPSQQHIDKMVQRSKEIHFRQMKVLSLNGDNVGGDFGRIKLETSIEKKERQAK